MAVRTGEEVHGKTDRAGKIKLVNQYSDWDCSIACAAMLAGVSYTPAAQAAGVCFEGEGLETRHFLRLLEHLTGQPWQYKRRVKRLLAREGLPIVPCGVLTCKPGGKPDHWIVVSDGLVYDPEWAENWDWPPTISNYQKTKGGVLMCGIVERV